MSSSIVDSDFSVFFRRATGFQSVHKWQARLAADSICRNRLIRIPTGFGKTAGVVLTWLWHRVYRQDSNWPRRLVYCLPMRTLVEQTERLAREWIERVRLRNQPKVHVLMGGLSPTDWHLDPEGDAVLIGTQDMLLSRALNRGYGSGRARWPMEFGLINVDCLWVMDEVQLMSVGLATSAQLQGIADGEEREGRMPRPRRTWWMSATLRKEWFETAPALRNVQEIPVLELEDVERGSALWNTQKSLQLKEIPAGENRARRMAKIIAKEHGGGVTLGVCNTVKTAVELHDALKREFQNSKVEIRLIHSRFRGSERRAWAKEFLKRESCGGDANRVIVTTQVIEAGVDISANLLVTELAPWTSLIQRFGRCARYGGSGRIIVMNPLNGDRDYDTKVFIPYELEELEAAGEALQRLAGSAAQADIWRFEADEAKKQDGGILPRLYPYAPLHVITRRELGDLFDTGPDLTGAEVDISRFIREGSERDVMVWWWPVPDGERPHPRLRPTEDALCRVAIGDARKWLRPKSAPAADEEEFGTGRTSGRRPRAWVWSYLDGEWEELRERHLYPGQTILVDANAGGYEDSIGFTGKSGRVRVDRTHVRGVVPDESADDAETQDDLSLGLAEAARQYKTIATHGREVAEVIRRLALILGVKDEAVARVLEFAGIFHDLGKAHPAFACAISNRNGIPSEIPLAKAPERCWHSAPDLFDHSPLGRRPSFRHEVASVLALMEAIWRASPEHPAMRGDEEGILEATIGLVTPAEKERMAEVPRILEELLKLAANQVNLVLYLIMSHHGKARATLPMSPRDQANPGRAGDLPIRGIREGDKLPELKLLDFSGSHFVFPSVELHLDPARLGLSCRYGPSWGERTLRLRRAFGDFQLAWFEALMRVADTRASRIHEPIDPLLSEYEAQLPAAGNEERSDGSLTEWIERSLKAVNEGRQGGQPAKGRFRRRAAARR